MSPLVQTDGDILACDLDDPLRVDKLPEQTSRACPRKTLQPFSQPAVQEVRQYRQGQVEFHVQANIAAQTVEVKKRDLLTKMILDVIPARVSLDDFSGSLRLRQVIGQEVGRGFVTEARHDQLPHSPFVVVELDQFIDVLNLATLPLGLGNLAMLPAVQGQTPHAPTCPSRDGEWW